MSQYYGVKPVTSRSDFCYVWRAIRHHVYQRQKSGRPGRFCDVMITYCHDFCRGSLSPPTRPRNRVHIPSYGSLRASKDTVRIKRAANKNDYGGRAWGRRYIEASC